jgi:hypothetical protein
VEVAEYVRDIAHELAAIARSAGHGRLSFLLEMAVLEAADLQERGGPDGTPSPCSGKNSMVDA